VVQNACGLSQHPRVSRCAKSRERLSSPNFPQLHFGEPSSGFTPGLGSVSHGIRAQGEARLSSLSGDGTQEDPQAPTRLHVGGARRRPSSPARIYWGGRTHAPGGPT